MVWVILSGATIVEPKVTVFVSYFIGSLLLVIKLVDYSFVYLTVKGVICVLAGLAMFVLGCQFVARPARVSLSGMLDLPRIIWLFTVLGVCVYVITVFAVVVKNIGHVAPDEYAFRELRKLHWEAAEGGGGGEIYGGCCDGCH